MCTMHCRSVYIQVRMILLTHVGDPPLDPACRLMTKFGQRGFCTPVHSFSDRHFSTRLGVNGRGQGPDLLPSNKK